MVEFFETHVPLSSVWKVKTYTPGWNGYYDLSAWYFKCFHLIKIQIFCYKVIIHKRSVKSDTVSNKSNFTTTWNEEKEHSYAYRIFTSRCCTFISGFTVVWNICHKDFPRSKEVTLFNNKPSQFPYFFMFIKRSLQYVQTYMNTITLLNNIVVHGLLLISRKAVY